MARASSVSVKLFLELLKQSRIARARSTARTDVYKRQQQFKNGKPADIGGVVTSRIRYSLVAGVITLAIFAAFGGTGGVYSGGSIDAAANPVSLVMLVPVVLMLVVSTKTRNIYEGILVGLFCGTAVALAAGIISVSYTHLDVYKRQPPTR